MSWTYLFVHHSFVRTQLEAKDSGQEEAKVIDPLGLERISMQELVLTSKGKALELESIKEVGRNEDCQLLPIDAGDVQVGNVQVDDMRKDIHLVNGISGGSHDGKIREETFESFVVGLLHELDEHAIIQDAIALFAFTVLDIGPIFIFRVDARKTVGIGFLVEHIQQSILVRIRYRGQAVVDGRKRSTSVGSHDQSKVVEVDSSELGLSCV